MEKTITAKTQEGSTFNLITLPEDMTFKDKMLIHIETELSWDECLSKLQAIAVNKSDDPVKSVLVIKGSVLSIKDNFSSIKLDGVEYPLKEDTSEYVAGFVSINKEQ